MPGFLIAAAHKSSGKTVVSTGLAAALTARGLNVQTFKKGPDYIDPMWLSAASNSPCYNLDFNIMDHQEVRDFYTTRAISGDMSLVETNKGLFDGMDTLGSDSNAALATLLQIPVVLVIDTNGMTRGIAPLLQGYAAFDSNIQIAGVILNKVGGPRHEAKLRAAVEMYSDIPVLGAIGRNANLDIGERHLGLTTPAETGALCRMIDRFGQIIEASVDMDQLIDLASGEIRQTSLGVALPHPKPDVKIGIAQDTSFGFYYADDLDAFAECGAELVPVDTLNDTELPDIDGLFIGGGFPETQMQGLSRNSKMRASMKLAIENGLPTYAECGGLMYLSKSLTWQGSTEKMVGVVPGDAVMHDRPQGRGYAQFSQTNEHLWGGNKNRIKAHEFHYASIDNLPDDVTFARDMQRGTGINGVRDGIVLHNLVAGFCHLRTGPNHYWVRDFVDFVRRLK